MITLLTKEEVAKLSPEDQEVIGRLALEDARSRRTMLAQAESYPGYRLVPTLLWIVASCLWVWKQDLAAVLPFFGLLVLIFMKFHIWGINSRLDAMIRIQNFDRSINEGRQAEQGEDAKAPPRIS